MILAADIGGTKTHLTLVDPASSTSKEVAFTEYRSQEYESFEQMLAEFLGNCSVRPGAASLAVAGPVINQEVDVTNLPWVINAERISESFSIPVVRLLNDLEATAIAIPSLCASDTSTIVDSSLEPSGNVAVIAPGTGLGEAFLTRDSMGKWQAHATEGGHSSFAPATEEQLRLVSYLMPFYGHVSYERVCSGSGIPNIYRFLKEGESWHEPEPLAAMLASAVDQTPVIVDYGLKQGPGICRKTLELFVEILGTEVGNFALKVFATGGVYLAGGMTRCLLPMLNEEAFPSAISAKGRFSGWISRIPVRVILDPNIALRGALCHARVASGIENAR